MRVTSASMSSGALAACHVWFEGRTATSSAAFETSVPTKSGASIAQEICLAHGPVLRESGSVLRSSDELFGLAPPSGEGDENREPTALAVIRSWP